MKVMLKDKKNIVVSIEIDGDVAPGLRVALAEECEQRFKTKSANDKLVFDLLANIEYELRKNLTI